jgi:hypothetical protein
MNDVKAEQYSLTVSAHDTLTEVMREYDTERGQAWADAVFYVTDNRMGHLVLEPDLEPVDEDMNPRNREPRDGVHTLTVWHEADAIKELGTLGYVTDSGNAWREADYETYADDPRRIDYVTVCKPFKVVTVEYSAYACSSPHGDGYARRWTITQTVTVEAGLYVIATYGIEGRVHSVGFSEDTTRIPTVEGLADVEGWCADRAFASCDTCRSRWVAESASWRFEADYGTTVDGFDYDDAQGFADNTIDCPAEDCSGRVGFDIY